MSDHLFEITEMGQDHSYRSWEDFLPARLSNVEPVTFTVHPAIVENLRRIMRGRHWRGWRPLRKSKGWRRHVRRIKAANP